MRKKYFYEIIFVLLVLIALFTGLSLFSYSPDDPSHSNIVFSRYEEPISNIFGKAGAYMADFMGTLFGWPALLLPFGFIYALVNIVKVYRQRFSGIKAAGGITAALLFIIMLSMVTGLIAKSDPFFPDKTGGGLLGVLAAVVIKSFLGRAGGIILCIILLLLLIFGMLRISVIDLVNKITQKMDDKAGSRQEKEAGPSFLEKIKNRVRTYLAEVKVKREERAMQKQADKEEQDRLKLEEMMKKADEDKSTKPYYMEETPITGDTPPVEEAEPDSQADTVPALSQEKKEATPHIESVDTGDISIIPPFQIEADNENPVQSAESDRDKLSGKTAAFEFPDKSELLTVAKLEQILAEHEKKTASNAAGSTMPDDTTSKTGETDDLDIFKEFIKDAHPVETAPDSAQGTDTAYFPPFEMSDRLREEGNVRRKSIDYRLPFELLEQADTSTPQPDIEELRTKADLLLQKLRDFNVDGTIREIRPGPVVTLFELEPAPGIKISKIANLENDLALAMSAISIRIIAPIPGKAAVGIEIPNEHRMTVKLRELLETKEFRQHDSPLAVAFGKDISGKPYFSDLRTMPHLLVAGTTGSGKSVCINTIICSILYKSSPQEVKFVMIDPKMVELNVYNSIPHLAAPVVTDSRKAAAVLNNVVKEMEARYKRLSECNVRNIDSYSTYIKSHPELAPMPYMVVIVDEFGDLMMVAGKEVEAAIIRIAQLARAVGIHLVLATQRPSVNVITGIIKANMPARISFRVSSKIDSRTILDQNGAELLLGRGDSLFIPPGTSFTTRIHGCFVSEEEVKNIIEDLKRYGEPEYDMALLEEPVPVGGPGGDDEIDSRYEEAVQIAREKGEASISMIQRYLRIGYNRAARIVETMEQHGLIASSDGTSKPRKFIGD